MRRMLAIAMVFIVLVGCKPSCSTKISEDTKSFVEQLQAEVRLRQAKGLIADDKYTNAGIENAEAFELWVAETKALLAYDQIGALATRFQYPFEVNLYDDSGKRTSSSPELVKKSIKAPEDFCEHYQYFMTDELKDLIVGQNMDSVDVMADLKRVVFEKGFFQIQKKKNSSTDDYEVTFIFN